MRFPERAVQTCVLSMMHRRVGERQVHDVLKYEDVDVTPIEQFLDSADDMVRRMAVRIVGKRGSADRLVDAALVEQDSSILMEMLHLLSKRKEGLNRLSVLLTSENEIVREEAICIFRRAGQAECLLPLLFDEDDRTVQRAKRYIYEQRKSTDT